MEEGGYYMNYENRKDHYEEPYKWPKGTPTNFKSCPICGSATRPGTVICKEPYRGWIKCTGEKCGISYEVRMEYNGEAIVTGKARTANGASVSMNQLQSQRHRFMF